MSDTPPEAPKDVKPEKMDTSKSMLPSATDNLSPAVRASIRGEDKSTGIGENTRSVDDSASQTMKSADKNIETTPDIQQTLNDFQLYKEKSKARDDHDLAADLRKFQNRGNRNPILYESDPLNSQTESQIKQADQRSVQHANTALERMQQNDSRWTEPIQALKDQGTPIFHRMETMDTFQKPPVVKEAKGNEIFYRRYGNDVEPIGRFMTPDHYGSPLEAQNSLALPENNTAEKEVKLNLDNGTIYLEGKAGPRYGHHGGGNQIFVPNKKAIHEARE